jgi:hypothetical protein
MQTASTWDGPVPNIRESLKRAHDYVLMQRLGPRLKHLWATKEAHGQLVRWLQDYGLVKPETKGDLQLIYGLQVTVFETKLDMLMQAWKHDLGEVIALATTDKEDHLYQVNFFEGLDKVRL